jgi:hypothetical protein
LQTLILVDLRLRLLEGGRGRKGLGYGLSLDSAAEAELRIVAGVASLGTVARRLSAATNDGTNGTRPEIAQSADLAEDSGAFGFQSGQRIGHVVPLSSE